MQLIISPQRGEGYKKNRNCKLCGFCFLLSVPVIITLTRGIFCGSLARVGILTYLCSRLLLIYSQYKYEILSIN
jgi:hypothetical protein